MIYGNLSAPLSIMDRTTRQKIFYKGDDDLNSSTNHLDLVDIYRTSHLIIIE